MEPENELERELAVLSHKWNEITDVPETPRSVMSVIEYSLGSQRKAEVYTNRLLRYFLDPEEPHGMNDDLLRAFLDGLPDECGFDEDTYDLSDAEVDDQVRLYRDADGETVSAGDVDLVVESPNEWFLMVEIKFSAGENNLRGEELSQTEKYYEASRIDSIPKEDYEAGGYYLYLHPSDEPRANEEGFANWTWGEVVDDVLKELIVENSSRYPQRTVAQLHEFADDIQEITGMTERQENDHEKVELYLEHYEAIEDVTDTFDERWGEFTDEWGRRLGNELETDGHGSHSEIEADVIGFEERDGTEWRFRSSSSDWGMVFKHGWWKHTDDLRKLNGRPDDNDDMRIGFHHRLGRNRDKAIRDRELVFYFRCMGANDQELIDVFNRKFYSRENEIDDRLPETAEITGKTRDMTKAVYDIRVNEHDDIFEAYTEALQRAFVEHVVENEELVSLLDETYDAAVENVYGD